MSTQPGQQTDFGANEWLVYEIHQQYLKDPDSVSDAWREFLSDYSPGEGAAGGTATATPAPPAAPNGRAPQADAPAPA
ncbi:MAG: hypothetical protein AVDCRST_MAG07-325, partial [uncultured Frankineae bacterium]